MPIELVGLGILEHQDRGSRADQDDILGKKLLRPLRIIAQLKTNERPEKGDD